MGTGWIAETGHLGDPVEEHGLGWWCGWERWMCVRCGGSISTLRDGAVAHVHRAHPLYPSRPPCMLCFSLKQPSTFGLLGL